MQVHNIPLTFSSRQQLGSSFLMITVEELRASLQSEMQCNGTNQQFQPVPLHIQGVRTEKHCDHTTLGCDIPEATTVLQPWQFVLLSNSVEGKTQSAQRGSAREASPVVMRPASEIDCLALVRRVSERYRRFKLP